MNNSFIIIAIAKTMISTYRGNDWRGRRRLRNQGRGRLSRHRRHCRSLGRRTARGRRQHGRGRQGSERQPPGNFGRRHRRRRRRRRHGRSHRGRRRFVQVGDGDELGQVTDVIVRVRIRLLKEDKISQKSQKTND